MNGSRARRSRVGKVRTLLKSIFLRDVGMARGVPFLMMKRFADEWSAAMMRCVRSNSSSSLEILASLSMMLLGPCSARYPSLLVVRMAPPSLLLDSNTVTLCPCLRRAWAALSPVMPAPRMAIFLLMMFSGNC